jgi:hypothetical protein
VLVALAALRVPRDARADELRGQLARQPGWASLAAWYEREAIHGWTSCSSSPCA